MPELPEVETVRRQLARSVLGLKVESIETDVPKMLKPKPEDFNRDVVGQSIVGLNRRAKFLIIELGNGLSIGVHLKMSGRLFYRAYDDRPDLYVHVLVRFNNGHELRFSESRKFGFFQLLRPEELKSILEKYGPEPLDGLSETIFFNILQGSKRRVKDVLLDQTKIGGVGNIYANDALWLAQVHPESRSDHLSRDESNDLLLHLESVIRESLEIGGASDNWYRHIDGKKGKYQEYFKVYGRTGEACPRHPDTKITYVKVSQRGTFICPKCQTKK